MNDDLHNIDDLFKKALEEYTELPSPAAWDNIDKGLDKKKVISISKKYHKLKWAAAILLLFSIGMAMYAIHIHTKNKELVKQSDTKNVKSENTQTRSKEKNYADTFSNNKPAAGKLKLTKELNAENKTNSLISTNDSTIHSSANKPDDNTKKGEGEVKTRNVPVKPGTERNKEGEIVTENRSDLLLRPKPGTKLKNNYQGIDSAGHNERNILKSTAGNSVKNSPVANKQTGNKDDNIVLKEEKYVYGIPQMLLMENTGFVFIKSFPYFSSMPVTNAKALHDKTVALKQHIEKKNNSFLMPGISATIFFSPDLVSTKVKNDAPRFREDDRHEIEQNEKFKSSSTIGLLLDYGTGKNWLLESGITFSTSNNYIQPKIIYAHPDNNGNINYRFNCSAGYSFINVKSAIVPASGDSIRALGSKNTLQYIGIPVTLKYMFTKGRFSILPAVGISANFLVKGKIETTIATPGGNEGAGSNDIQGLKPTYFSGLAGVGIKYNLNKMFALTFTPTARFALSSINRDAPVKTYLNAFGFAVGAGIRF